jgi:RHS repeat-associated protein
LITDAAGSTSTASTITYDPYGNQVSTSGSLTTNLMYTGQYLDSESGLYYNRARYCSPGAGHFLMRDPAVAKTISPYAYVAGDPLNASDPSGLRPIDDGKGEPPRGTVGMAWADPAGDGTVMWSVGVVGVFKKTPYTYSVSVDGQPTTRTAGSFGANLMSGYVSCAPGSVIDVVIDVKGSAGDQAQAECPGVRPTAEPTADPNQNSTWSWFPTP